jgi:hypothetical protein
MEVEASTIWNLLDLISNCSREILYMKYLFYISCKYRQTSISVLYYWKFLNLTWIELFWGAKVLDGHQVLEQQHLATEKGS